MRAGAAGTGKNRRGAALGKPEGKQNAGASLLLLHLKHPPPAMLRIGTHPLVCLSRDPMPAALSSRWNRDLCDFSPLAPL